MRNVLKSSSEVFHFFANQVQPSGRAGSVHFETRDWGQMGGMFIYSYGRHFCMARHVAGAVVMTTRTVSMTTSGHLRGLRAALGGQKIVYCNDPADSARENVRVAREEIAQLLGAAQNRQRIRQTTRDSLRAKALHLADCTNAYLDALPANELDSVARVDTSNLESVRDELLAQQKRDEAARLLSMQKQAEESAVALALWRVDSTFHASGFHANATALRYHDGAIQTSHGAQIPVEFASKIWALATSCRANSRALSGLSTPCGHYHLNEVSERGDIRVGCHNISFEELEKMAVILGYIENANA